MILWVGQEGVGVDRGKLYLGRGERTRTYTGRGRLSVDRGRETAKWGGCGAQKWPFREGGGTHSKEKGRRRGHCVERKTESDRWRGYKKSQLLGV